ncbi:hypothetical protein B0I37DRAFT_431989 [Chaetomium sp. MPI-CAGE-AT-0009]|nr:hypothetical protein B0I37DRAFT_431989 [Chaetomium sp. MPI-CAGE-AT-0009]
MKEASRVKEDKGIKLCARRESHQGPRSRSSKFLVYSTSSSHSHIKPITAPSTFQFFSKLPTEVRKTIWAFAIRPERPSVHFFTCYQDKKDSELSLLSPYAIRHERQWESGLAAPIIGNIGDGDQENEFSWGIESGDERRFKSAGLNEQVGTIPDKTGSPEHLPDSLDAAWFLLDGEWQRCVVRVERDLFFLQPFDPQTIQWEYFEPFPFGARRETPFKYDANHVALDWDLNGDWDSPEAVCAIKAATERLHWVKHLWFVHSLLRRKLDVPSTPNRLQFHGNGCIFTEVRDGDKDWYWNTTTREPPILSPLLYRIECEVTDILNDEDEISPPYLLIRRVRSLTGSMSGLMA